MKADDEDGSLRSMQRGIAGGFIAGAFFLGFEMTMTAMLRGPHALTTPLRMIGGILLGPSALDRGYPLLTAATAGLIVHGGLSATFGAMFGLALRLLPLRRPGEIVAAGITWGLALWLLNFYVVARFAGWPWFAIQTDPVVQFVAHAVFFGALLGMYVAFDGRPPESLLIPKEGTGRPMMRAG